MNVSVIVTHHRTPEVLRMALGYLEKWQHDYEKEKKGSAEIIVADSHAIPETREMLRDLFPNIKLVSHNENIGFGRVVNSALKETRGAIIVLLNADIVVPRPSELNKLLTYLDEHKDVGIVGPQLKNFDNTWQPSAFRYYNPSTIIYRRTPLGKSKKGKRAIVAFTLRDAPEFLQKPTPVDWLMGSAMVIRREPLERLGGFDERFFMYMEDVDLCRRFWEEGFKVMYYPAATFYHYHGGASRNRNILMAPFNTYTRAHIKSAVKYFRKHGLHTPRYGV